MAYGITKIKLNMGANTLRCAMNCWPPLLFTGIRIRSMSADFRRVSVQMSLRWYNRNLVGTQFGGNLYAMTDPFYMLMLVKNLGDHYYVWDQSADIQFVAVANEKVYADFLLSDDDLAMAKQQTQNGNKFIQYFDVEIKTASANKLVATVRKGVYIRLKPHYRPA